MCVCPFNDGMRRHYIPREFLNNVKAFSGLAEQVAADIRLKSGARNLFVDVTGMSPENVERMQQIIQKALELSNTQKRVWIIQVP